MTIRLLGALALIVICSAHVGSPDAWYEGSAGPYHVIVQVATPGVVPGVAKVYVRPGAEGVREVTVQANRFDALATAPPPEIAKPVEGDAGLYMAPLWIMSAGSNSVTVTVTGTLGSGKAVIPVVVVADRRLGMNPLLGAALSAVGLFLFIGLVTIIGAAVREGVLDPGQQPDAGRNRRARIAMAAATIVIVVALFGGSKWWQSEDENFTESMYKPLRITAAIDSSSGGRFLRLAISDSIWMMRHDSAWLRKQGASRWTPLIADHGKIMHTFLVRDSDMLAFGHLHPTTTDSVTFVAALPPLPPGRYRVYGDIVHESGFTQTLTALVDLLGGARGESKLTDEDDATHAVTTPPDGRRALLADGSVMTFRPSASRIVATRSVSLRFSVADGDGKPAKLEPYIGMPGHAVVSRDDGSVFVHLHPSGTVSMASQMAFMMREPGDSIAGRLGKRLQEMDSSHTVAPPMPADGTISFPYAFPKPGNYHVWVQVKRAGRVLTGLFPVTVEPEAT